MMNSGAGWGCGCDVTGISSPIRVFRTGVLNVNRLFNEHPVFQLDSDNLRPAADEVLMNCLATLKSHLIGI